MPFIPLLSVIALSVSAQQAPLRDLDAYVARAVKDWRVPGLAMAVVKDDSVVFLKAYGVREAGKPDPVTVHTRFGIMSTTKAFTTMLLAMLADSGRVSWDDPVTKFIPALELKDPWVTRELTLRDIVTHRVGFGDPGYLWYADTLSLTEITRRLRYVPVETSMRSRFAYNNIAYALAGEVAARASGASWADLMRTRIYQPLGMTESYATEAALHAAGVTDWTAPHDIIRDTVRVLPGAAALVDPIAPAGAMVSSATDMAKWLRFLLDSGRVAGRRLVSAGNFAQLFTAQQIVPDDEFYPTARLTKPHFQAYGMGWFLEDYRGEYVTFHTGSIDGRTAIVGMMPDRRLGVAILANLDHAELRHALMYTVFDRFLPAPSGAAHDWSAEMRAMYGAMRDSALVRQAKRVASRVTGTHPSLPLDRYTGNYSDDLFGAATVRKEGDHLVFATGVQTGDLEHWQYDLFRVHWRNSLAEPDYLSFSLDASGTPDEVRFPDAPMRYHRSR